MTLYNWSQTAAADATADSTINWAEGQAPSELENSLRKSHDCIRAACIESNKTAELKSLFNEVLEKLK